MAIDNNITKLKASNNLEMKKTDEENVIDTDSTEYEASNNVEIKYDSNLPKCEASINSKVNYKSVCDQFEEFIKISDEHLEYLEKII